MSTIGFWTVDHVGSERAVVVDDTGHAVNLPLAALPSGIEKLTVLRVDVPEGGAIDWSAATIDPEETDRRRQRSENISKRLRLSDPQGFIYMPDE